jgi:hypothetical protein
MNGSGHVMQALTECGPPLILNEVNVYIICVHIIRLAKFPGSNLQYANSLLVRYLCQCDLHASPLFLYYGRSVFGLAAFSMAMNNTECLQKI